jgi:hypothetical protein
MTKCLDDQIISVAASRKPNSVHLRSRLHVSFGVTIIPLVLSSLTGSSDRPGGLRRAACGTPPYLVLLRAGFCLPPVLPQARCALTAPFHHCLRFARARASYGEIGCVFSVPLSFELPRPGVTRRTALRSSDFPPPPPPEGRWRRRSSGSLRQKPLYNAAKSEV